MIKDGSGAWQTADLGDDSPAMSYQANNLAELKDRQADYSQAINLPLTPNNCAIFGYAHVFDVHTSFPYSKHDCRLYDDDFVLAGKGSFLVLIKTSDSFECQILSGNADFFETIKDAPMTDIDLGTIERDGYAMIPSAFNDTYCFAAATFIAGGDSAFDFDPEYSFPFVYLKKAIEQICAQNGYTLVHNLTSAELNSKALPVVTLKPRAGSYVPFDSSAVTASQTIWPSQYNPVPVPFFWLTNLAEDPTPERVEIVGSTVRFTASEACTVDIGVLFEWTGGVVYPVLTVITHKSKGVTTTILSEDSSETEHSLRAYAGINDVIEVQCTIRQTSEGAWSRMQKATVSFTSVDNEIVPLRGLLYLADNLGFETQLDLFKTFVQLFGMTVYVDQATATIYCYTMKKVYDNKAIARDWSAKLHTADEETRFTVSGYGQRNYIKMLENKDDAIEDIGAFDVDNSTLEKEKTLFSLKIESGMDSRIADYMNRSLVVNPNPTEYTLVGVGWQARAYKNEPLTGLYEIEWVHNKALVTTTLTDGMVVLLPEQTNAAQNGLWVAHSGAWTRHPLMDTWAELVDAYVGYAYDDGKPIFHCTAAAGGTIGVTENYWEQVWDDSMIYVSNNTVANIPLIEKTPADGYGDEELNIREGKPHIVELTPMAIVPMTDINGDTQYLRAANHVTAQSFVDSFYSEIVDMLSSAKIQEAYFNLTAEDIENRDPFVPVWVEKYGAYFFVNKIVNFQSGRLTKCELIKL